jgi:hypothetical protein
MLSSHLSRAPPTAAVARLGIQLKQAFISFGLPAVRNRGMLPVHLAGFASLCCYAEIAGVGCSTGIYTLEMLLVIADDMLTTQYVSGVGHTVQGPRRVPWRPSGRSRGPAFWPAAICPKTYVGPLLTHANLAGSTPSSFAAIR